MDKQTVLDLLQDLIDEKERLMFELELENKVNRGLVQRTSMVQYGLQQAYTAVQEMKDHEGAGGTGSDRE